MAYESVKALHRHLCLDTSFTPNSQVLNVFINAYQRLGMFNDALKVFNVAWLSGRMDDVVVTVMFDACGHNKRRDVAYLVWAMLVRNGWEFDRYTLNAWVECLCRLGQVDMATNFVCHHMGRETGGYKGLGNTNPDESTCTLLLKFAWNVGQYLEVKQMLRTYLPDIWPKLSRKYIS